jgi:hypothetical protein
MRNWFKLVGASNQHAADGSTVFMNIPDDWARQIPSLFTAMRFPRHRPPTNISNNERIIAYAVGKGKVFAVQTRDGNVRNRKPYGPVGSVTSRYPNEMDVTTHAHVPNIANAPDLKRTCPDFMDVHGSKFRQGSHWLISDEHYDALEAAIVASGEGSPAPLPPRREPRTRGE